MTRLGEMTAPQLIFELTHKNEAQLLGLQTYRGP